MQGDAVPEVARLLRQRERLLGVREPLDLKRPGGGPGLRLRARVR
jgi:hypothetical protein